VSFKSSTIFNISNNIVFRKQDEEKFVLLEIEGENLFELDEVSAFIWDQISKNNNYGQIINALEDEYEDFGNDQVNETNEFLESLISKNIISIS
jgi:hypothetical protein